MAALTQPRMSLTTTWKNVPLVLAGSQAVFQGGIACLDTSANAVKKGASGSTTLVRIGEFMQTLDNSATTATTYVMVELDKEIVLRWYNNATGAAAITSSQLYTQLCYILDDQTVTSTTGSNSVAGRVWAIDPVKGVAVQETNT